MKTAVITGASGGIGSATALAFAKDGYNVVLQYNNSQDKALALAKKIENGTNSTALPVKADVSSSQEVTFLFDEVENRFGNVDVLVNNAGIAQQKLFTDITDEDWRRMTGTNLDGVFYCSREVLKRFMIKNHSGVILNVSSMWGQVGASCETLYSMTKAGVIGLTKALAKELAPSNITVNCIAPGIIDTRMNNMFDAEELKEEVPLGRLGTPEEIAKAVLFFAENPYITGQILGVNGGIVI